MGGYETLAAVQRYALAVVASEETEPGDGDDYTGMLRATFAAPPVMPPRRSLPARHQGLS
jgi:hypothetical protein